MNKKRPTPFESAPGPMLRVDGHLTDDWLLLSIDGELSSSEEARVREHIYACWTCRARRERIERAIEDVVHYEHALVASDMPPSPGAKASFMIQLDQLASESGHPSFIRQWGAAWLRAYRALFFPQSIWAAAAALALVATLYITLGRHTPNVSANQLLQRAADSRTRSLAGIDRPVVVQKVSIQAHGRKITRTFYRDPVRKQQTSRTDVNASDEQLLEQDFERSSFNWDDPLSPQAYSRWRDGIPEKRDVVERLSDGLLRLDTSTAFGPVAEASLIVRAADFHPIAEDFRLRDNTEIEIAELTYAVVGSTSLPADIFGAPIPPPLLRLPAASTTRPIRVVSPNPAQIAASELQARSALHSIQADLGEQISVHATTEGWVEINGVAQDEARKQQIIDALSGIRHVRLAVTTVEQAVAEPPANPSPSTPVRAPLVVTPNRPLLEEQLERRFPDSDQRIQYVNQSLSICQSASARAWAVNRLADRYTPQQIALLDTEAQHQLQSLLVDHIMALREEISRLQNQLGQVLSARSNTAAANTASPDTTSSQVDDWRIRARRIHSSVETASEAVSALLAGTSDTTDSADKLQISLRTTLTQLQADLQSLDQQIHKQL